MIELDLPTIDPKYSDLGICNPKVFWLLKPGLEQECARLCLDDEKVFLALGIALGYLEQFYWPVTEGCVFHKLFKTQAVMESLEPMVGLSDNLVAFHMCQALLNNEENVDSLWYCKELIRLFRLTYTGLIESGGSCVKLFAIFSLLKLLEMEVLVRTGKESRYVSVN